MCAAGALRGSPGRGAAGYSPRSPCHGRAARRMRPPGWSSRSRRAARAGSLLAIRRALQLAACAPESWRVVVVGVVLDLVEIARVEQEKADRPADRHVQPPAAGMRRRPGPRLRGVEEVDLSTPCKAKTGTTQSVPSVAAIPAPVTPIAARCEPSWNSRRSDACRAPAAPRARSGRVGRRPRPRPPSCLRWTRRTKCQALANKSPGQAMPASSARRRPRDPEFLGLGRSRCASCSADLRATVRRSGSAAGRARRAASRARQASAARSGRALLDPGSPFL